MAKTGFGAIIAFVPSWAKGKKKARGFVFKSYHMPESKGQKAQQLKLARAAYSLYNQNLRRGPFVAAITPLLGGTTGLAQYATPEARRAAMHGKAMGTINRLTREVGGAAAPLIPGV